MHTIIYFSPSGNVLHLAKKLAAGLERFEAVSLIAVGSAGNWLNEAVSSDLRKSLGKKEYSIVVDETLAMPLTLIMNFPEDLSRKLITESEQKIASLSTRIMEMDPSEKDVQFKSKLVNFMGKAEAPAACLFGLELHANNDCTSCGTCWTNCPQRNIKQKSNGKPGFGFNCIMCLRCIYHCPEQAISPRISKFIPINGGYTLSKFIQK